MIIMLLCTALILIQERYKFNFTSNAQPYQLQHSIYKCNLIQEKFVLIKAVGHFTDECRMLISTKFVLKSRILTFYGYCTMRQTLFMSKECLF